MTRSVETEPKALWAIEIEQEDEASTSEFYNVVALKVSAEELQILTPGGTQVSFKGSALRKVLLMRVKEQEAVDAS